MSVDCSTYCGVFVNILDLVEDPWEDRFLPFIEGWKNEKFSMIYDGMCGGYCYFGVVLAEVDEDSGKHKEIEVELISELIKDTKDKLKSIDIIPSENPKLIIFNHYS